MLSTGPASNTNSEGSHSLLFSILDDAELGILVVDASGSMVYINHSARSMINAPAGHLPEWVGERLTETVPSVLGADQRIERWQHDDLVLRVRARRLDHDQDLVVLEIRLGQGAGARHVADQLARGLGLTISDGKLLALLWRGMSNDEIAEALSVRVGTIKSRLFRLYQRLGVRRRPAAVLRAAEILAA